MSELLDNLNPKQREAAETTEGPLLLLAGAGSGKTRVLVHRMAHLVEKGVRPHNILAITFTNKAAKEMRHRVENIIPSGADIWVSTFHSMCVKILRIDVEKTGFSRNFTIYDAQDAERLVKDVIKQLNIDDKKFPAKSVMYEISNQKNELLTPEDMAMLSEGDFRLKTIAKIYSVYQRRLIANNALDFDDIIMKTVELFSTHPDVLEKYQNRFRYIMVDEYQDTNTSQYQLIRFLSAKYENLCVVGDDDQSIYGWRGANINNILDFEKDFTGAKVIKLEQNYRSTGNILNAANTVIKNNSSRKGKKLWTDKGEGDSINLFRAETDIQESIYVMDTILRAVKLGKKHSEFAVLYRTNALSRVIEETLFKNGVPYRIFGGIRFYERREIKDVLAYLKAVANPNDEISLKRVINVPKRGIGDTTIEKITLYAVEEEMNFLAALKNAEEALGKKSKTSDRIGVFLEMLEMFRTDSESMPVSDLIKKVIDETGYLDNLLFEKTSGNDDSQDRLENVKELISKAAEFEKQSETPTLAAFLEDVALVADIDNYSETDDTVVLMTLHSAKGLEFPNVFIVGVEENIFPGYRAVSGETEKEMEEERRLCYVGITRAMERLYLSNSVIRRHNGAYVSNAPSRFLREIPKELINSGAERKIQAKNPQPAKQGFDKPFSAQYKKRIDPISVPVSKEKLDFVVGDMIEQARYGVGKVLDIREAGADYEVLVSFSEAGNKKFMAHLAKLKKANI